MLKAGLAAVLVTAPALAALLWLSGSLSLAACLGAAASVAFVVGTCGEVLLRALNGREAPLAAAWVIGVVATAFAVYVLVMAFHLLAATAFAIWAATVVCAALTLKRRYPIATTPWRDVGVLALAVCSAATFFWCSRLAEVPVHLAHDGVMTTWTDEFIHAAQISQFGDPRAAGRHFIQLADTPRPLYHYVSYMLPAALAWPLDLPGLPLATSFWIPVGFLTLCAGIYALGAALAGPGGGFASLVVLTLVPDAASYGLLNRAFGYYWNVLEVPGAPYAMGACLVAFALLRTWLEAGNRRALIASAGLMAASAPIRVHIFLLAFPAWLLSVAMLSQPGRRYRLVLCLAAAVAFALFVFGYYAAVPGATPALAEFLRNTHELNYPLPYEGWFRELSRAYGPDATLIAGFLLVFPASLGLLLLLYPLTAWLARRAGGWHAIDVVPVVLFVCYVLLLLTAPIPWHGDATELTQRPFVLVYAVLAIWMASRFITWLRLQGGLATGRAWLILAGVAAAGAAGTFAFTAPDARWDEFHRLTPGLTQAARFIRLRSGPGDMLAVQGLDPGPWGIAADMAIEFVALTGVPAYLSRPYIHHIRGGLAKEVAGRRYAELEKVAHEPSLADATGRLRALGIRWYIAPGSAGPAWDTERRHAALVAGQIAVYRVDRGGDDEQ